MANKKTLCLEVEYDYNFDLFGVVSSGKDYKLAWTINKLLNLHLIKQQDIQYYVAEEPIIVSCYECSNDYGTVRLIRNNALNSNVIKMSFLLPEVKEFNYLLQISGVFRQNFVQDLLIKLLHIPLVQYVKKIDPLTLKFRENLLF